MARLAQDAFLGRVRGLCHGAQSWHLVRTSMGAGGGLRPPSPMLVAVPPTGDAGRRLEQVAAQVRAHKAAATGPPPIAVLGWLFRPLAALGG